MNEIRKERGKQIAETSRIMKRERGGYVVPSQSGNLAYIVRYEQFKPKCECPDFEQRGLLGIKCKHIWAVEITLNKKVYPDGTIELTKTIKKTYSQDWSAYNKAQTNEKQMFLELLSELCNDISNKPYEFGRPKLSMADMVFASALKVYTTFSLRRFVSDMRFAKEKGFTDTICSYSSISNYMRNPKMTLILMNLILKSAIPLKAIESKFAVDSSGFSTCRFDRWFSFKYGKEINSRIWIKAHIMNGVKTNVITSVKITEAYDSDNPQFSGLVKETAKTFEIKEVSADKGYLGYENMKLVEELGGTAYIPFKSSSTSRARHPKLWKKMFHYFMFNREEFLEHYHQRSNVETTFHMIKSKFGSSLRSKNNIAQVNEILLKVLCHNICVIIQEMHELGIKPDFENLNRGNSNG